MGLGKAASEFRNYEAEPTGYVEQFYRRNHANQTLAFVESKKAEYLGLDRERMTVWEMLEHLNDLVDESDPDTNFTQIDHALQTAEAARRANQPRWMVATGFIHDLGKVLCKFGEPQWAVVGDTFPVGCAYSDKVVFPEFFVNNPDYQIPEYQTAAGVYSEGCGLDKVHMSWGHDEYMYHVVKDYLPAEALYMIRYHSFYAAHKEGAYDHLMNDRDREMFEWVRRFNPYDLYSKADTRPDLASLKPYYEDLIAEYFPPVVSW
jgi:inositol oxygenase